MIFIKACSGHSDWASDNSIWNCNSKLFKSYVTSKLVLNNLIICSSLNISILATFVELLVSYRFTKARRKICLILIPRWLFIQRLKVFIWLKIIWNIGLIWLIFNIIVNPRRIFLLLNWIWLECMLEIRVIWVYIWYI